MSNKETKPIQLIDIKPDQIQFQTEVLEGLNKPQKELPSKYFYDETGSKLFDQICTLEEYYIPKIEIAIMKAHIKEIIEVLGPNVLLIEYGSGSSLKTRILLDNLI